MSTEGLPCVLKKLPGAVFYQMITFIFEELRSSLEAGMPEWSKGPDSSTPGHPFKRLH